MTATLGWPPPPNPYEQPPPDDPGADAAAVLALFFASAAAIRAVTLPAHVVDQLVSAGVAPKAARAAGRMALSVPLTGRSRHGAPNVPDPSTWVGFGTPDAPSMARRVAADEPAMRARYVLNAASRLTTALVGGQFLGGLHREQTLLTSHVHAGRNRSRAASALDDVAAKHGRWLRWKTTGDDKVTADCAVLEGAVFTVDDPPGVPGALHARCRCSAVPLETPFAPWSLA